MMQRERRSLWRVWRLRASLRRWRLRNWTRVMEDHWTPPLSAEGTQELIDERDERPAETPQRLELLRRVREAVRSLDRGGSRNLVSRDR